MWNYTRISDITPTSTESDSAATEPEIEKGTASENSAMIPSMVPVFIVISVIALLGNFLVVFLFVRNNSWLKKAHSCLILALAITDILTAVCILTVPLFIHDGDVYPVPENSIARELYCRIVSSHYLVFSLGVTSVYICLFLAIERWVAIGKPLFYNQHIHSKRNIALMVLLPWIAGFTFESPALIHTTGVVHPGGTAGCKWNPDTREWPTRVAIAVVCFLGMIMIPGLLVVVTYVHILIKVKATSINSQPEREPSKLSKIDFKRITTMCGIASITLIICWLPGQIYFMLGQMDYVKLDVVGHRWLNVLALSNSCFNPFIYAYWNPKYREGFKTELAMLVFWRRRQESLSLTNQSKNHSYGVVARRDEASPPETDV